MKDTTILRTIKYEQQLLSLNGEQLQDFMKAVIQYQKTGDIISDIDPVVSMLFQIMKIERDHDEMNWSKKSEKMKGNQNARKDWQITTKQTQTESNRKKQTKTKGNRVKQKKQEIEIELEEEIEDNNKLINNNLTVIGDTESGEKNLNSNPGVIIWDDEEKEKDSAEKEKEYGNAEVNLCMQMIKSYNHGVTNGSDARQRQRAWNLIKKLNQLDSVLDGRTTREKALEALLKVISVNPYYSTKIGSPELIFKNLGSLINVCKDERAKAKSKADNTLKAI